MGYEFRLEKVLWVRNRERDQAAVKNAEAKTRLERARQRLRELEGELSRTERDLDQVKRTNKLDAESLYYHSLHCAGLHDDIKRAEREVAEANAEAAQTSSKLTEAHKASEVMEKLKKRDHSQWRKEVNRKESQAMDEIAISRHRIKGAK